MPNYTKSAAAALRMITNFGQSVTRRAYGAATYDPATGLSTPATTDTTRKGAILDIGAGKQHINGVLVEKTDKQLFVDAEADINIQDHFIVDGTEYSILSVGGLNPAGTQVYYDLHLRA